MATKKDLVEAYAFSRRRLVTAFVSGAPGGREVEPARPGRTIVAGIALAVLLLAGAAIAGVFKDIAPGGWDDQPGLIIDKDSGALYVVLDDEQIPGSDDPTLRSVVNVTSAQLILGADAEAQSVPGDEIADTQKGPPIGIIGAPATVPDPDQLINDGWTACTADGHGVRALVTGDPGATDDPGLGLVVSNHHDLYLVAEAPPDGADQPPTARAYPLPKRADELTTALGLDLPSAAIDVPDKWFALFQPGGSLDDHGFDLPGAGSKVTGDAASYVHRGTRVGDWFTDGDRHWVVLQDAAAELSPFEFAVLSHSRFGGHKPGQVDMPDGITYVEKPWQDAAQFPEGPLHPPGSDQVCAVLDTDPDLPPTVRLAVDPVGDATASDLGANQVDVTVMSGHGAVVHRGGSSGEDGPTYLVDDRGMSYQVDGEDAVTNLGYDGVADVVVPDDWMELFAPGAVLSVERALCPPSSDPEAPCK